MPCVRKQNLGKKIMALFMYILLYTALVALVIINCNFRYSSSKVFSKIFFLALLHEEKITTIILTKTVAFTEPHFI